MATRTMRAEGRNARRTTERSDAAPSGDVQGGGRRRKAGASGPATRADDTGHASSSEAAPAERIERAKAAERPGTDEPELEATGEKSEPQAAAKPVPILPAPPGVVFRHAGPAGPRIGIGVITYRRAATAVETIAQIRRFTHVPFQLVIADDGSSAEDLALLRSAGPVVTGQNRGVTWNKNRALFQLHAVSRCDVVILLEDDTRPTRSGWEKSWIDAAGHWGHANLAGHWFRDRVLAGAGTAEQPFVSRDFSGQCTVFSREALDYVGYLDTRYRGFGIGHVDHTYRLARIGYGAMRSKDHGNLFYLIDSPLDILPAESARKDEDVRRNHALYQTLQHEGVHRNPWSTDKELEEFRAEQRAFQA